MHFLLADFTNLWYDILDQTPNTAAPGRST